MSVYPKLNYAWNLILNQMKNFILSESENNGPGCCIFKMIHKTKVKYLLNCEYYYCPKGDPIWDNIIVDSTNINYKNLIDNYDHKNMFLIQIEIPKNNYEYISSLKLFDKFFNEIKM